MTVVVQDLIELAERCEKAMGQDHGLDARIAYAVKPALARCGTLEEWLATDASKHALTYTFSVDDALTLLPFLEEIDRPLSIRLSVSESGKLYWASIHNWKFGDIKSNVCKTWSLALSSALLRLRARASIKGEG